MNLEPEFVVLIKKILKKYFPQAQIFLFGSRVRQQNDKFSDIDIAVKGAEVTPKLLALARFDLAESDLPYKTDLVNYNELPTEILQDAIEI